MTKITGIQIYERAKKLKPARLWAFQLWQEKPQITNAELEQALKDAGFEVIKFTLTAWLQRFKKRGSAKTKGGVITYNRPKARPARALAFKLWQENPQIGGTALHQAIKEQDFEASLSNCYRWLKIFGKDKGVDTLEEKPNTGIRGSRVTIEEIIKAAGSVETLSVLFYQGVMQELTRKDAVNHILKQECITKDNKISNLKVLLDGITRERNRIMREYNEKLAKVKIGTLTLDQSTHRLVPKV